MVLATAACLAVASSCRGCKISSTSCEVVWHPHTHVPVYNSGQANLIHSLSASCYMRADVHFSLFTIM